MKQVRLPFILSVFGYIVFAATQPMLAKLMELIVESIENNDSEARWFLPLLAVGIFALRGLGSFFGDYFNEFVGAKVIMNLKTQVFNHLITLPAAFYDKTTHGQLLHQLNNGVERVHAVLTTAIKTQIREGLTVFALLGYVFYLNWKLSLIFLFLGPLLALLVSKTGKKFRQISRRSEGAAGKALQVSKELMSNYSVVRGFGAQDYELARYQKAVDRAYKMQLKIQRIAGVFTPLSQLIVASALAFIIFLVLTPEILSGNTAGELVGYLTAAGLVPKPLRQLSRMSVVVQRGLIGAEMVFGLLDKRPEGDHGAYHCDRVSGRIEIKNLRFSYPQTQNTVLDGISFQINPGEMVALVGRSGSGKSTIASLLYRLYEVPGDSVFLDGTDINDYQLSNLRSHISVVNQNIALFDDTIKNNIAYGDQNYSDEDIIQAAKQAQAYDFIIKLPQGFNTLVGEDGILLSGGQRQRVSIARAFLKPAPILILDEATSSLDNESEALITKAIESLASSRTTLVIAHRLTTILKADRLIVLENGKIAEQGNHHELLQKKGAYYNLYMSEFSNTDTAQKTSS